MLTSLNMNFSVDKLFCGLNMLVLLLFLLLLVDCVDVEVWKLLVSFFLIFLVFE